MKGRSAAEIARTLEERSQKRIRNECDKREQKLARKRERQKQKRQRRAQERREKPNSPRFHTERGFYSSQEWLVLRHKVLLAWGPKCMLCNATREDGIKLHVDHIKPRSRYPELSLKFENLQVLCEDCNRGKQATDTTDWRPKPSEVAELTLVYDANKRI